MVEGVTNVYLQPMQQKVKLLNPEYETIPLISDEEISLYQKIIQKSVKHCLIRKN